MPSIAMDNDSKKEFSSIPPRQNVEEDPSDLTTLSTRSSKTQIQLSPPLWLHIKVDRYSQYSASAQAWVTLGESEMAKKYAVESLSVTLSFATTTTETVTNNSSLTVNQRSKEKCYNKALGSASTTGPKGSASASTY